MYIKVKRLSDTAKLPTRTNPSDAGMDVYADLSKLTTNSCIIHAQTNKKIPTNISIEIPHGYCLLVKNRSGFCSKNGVMKGAEVIDAGYSGPIFIDLHNVSQMDKTISHHEKIAQLIMVPVICPIIQEVDEIYENEMVISNRGEKGFGSSGNE